MDTIFTIIATVIATSGLFAALFIIASSRRAGEPEVPWEKIRPILLYVFAKIMELSEKKRLGYQAVEDFAVDLIHEEIQNTEFFTQEEKALLTKSLIRSLFKNKLKSLYDNEIKG